MAKVLIVLCSLFSAGLLVAVGFSMLEGDNVPAEIVSRCADKPEPRERDICLEDAAKHVKANGALGVAPSVEQN